MDSIVNFGLELTDTRKRDAPYYYRHRNDDMSKTFPLRGILAVVARYFSTHPNRNDDSRR